MPQTWKPTAFGKLFTTTIDWALTLDKHQFMLYAGNAKLGGNALELENLHLERGTFWSTIKLSLPNHQMLTLDGIPNSSAIEMLAAIETTVKKIRYRQRIEQLIRDFKNSVQPILQWADKARALCKVQLKTKGWLTFNFKAELNRIKPRDSADLFAEPEVQKFLHTQPQDVQGSLNLWKQNFDVLADSINERHLATELEDFKEFFAKVEKSPLTDEQAKAVVCFENRVLLVASAGSGKTSTMVAKAAYALEKEYFPPEKILLLAFNNDAAAELRERIKARLEPLGLPADKVMAKTFHAFGLDIIGAATGKRPSLAPWVENGKDIETLLEIVDELKDRGSAFRANWDMFRLVIGQDLPKFGKEEEMPDAWDSDSRRNGFWTLNNEVVKSRGELLIANWLFYNGVKYEYEASYKHDTADGTHRQYRPDFYIPDIDAYLEHWAVDEKGEPPPEFVGYKQGMDWKKKLHAEHGTTLLETTMAGLWSGVAFKYLAGELTKRGIVLDPNPDRPVPGRKPIENPRLARTFRSFLTHSKSNRLTMEELHKRLVAGDGGQFRYRHAMFLGLFEQISKSWEDKLRSQKCIDFEDMLNSANDCVEQGRWASPYELVMVDEFQDVSQARARLIAALVHGSGKCLFAVGDDWQSINRFAGADLSVMTDFDARFGRSVTLKLETTFRCPQSLCDISSAFVQENPKQIRKAVRAARPNVVEPVQIVRVNEENKIRTAVSRRLEEIAITAQPTDKKAQVYILGRYNKENLYVPVSYDTRRIDVKFITVHSSKGLEADHIIIPRMTSEMLGFPSRVADDPVLQLAMPGGDSFEYAEERRLFYVALTRARSSVTLITLLHKESPFVVELVNDHKLEIRNLDGSENSSEVCPSCNEGFLVKRNGKYGLFYGCSRFPRCTHTRKASN